MTSGQEGGGGGHDDENELIILVYNMLEWKWIYRNNDDDLYQGIYYLVQTSSTIFQNMFLGNNTLQITLSLEMTEYRQFWCPYTLDKLNN